MPEPKTHQIFYKQLKYYLDEETLCSLPDYDDYSIYSQGHDFLIYCDLYKIFSQKHLERNINLLKKLQEFSFQEFVYQYLYGANDRDALNDQQVQLFLGPGYNAHHR